MAPLLSSAGLALALLAALVATLAGPGHRFDWWSFGTGFALLRFAAYGGIAAAVIAAAGLILAPLQGHRRGMFRAVAGLAIGLLVVALPWSQLQTARSVPPIHDITTDTTDPPAFEAIAALRDSGDHPVTYAGEPVAAQQREAYPDIRPVLSSLAPDEAFERALAAAEAMDWQIVDADAEARRIEAVDQTFWFGFEDDVVIRVRPQSSGSRIDVRSASRVGVGDAGTNARRVRAYLEELGERLPAGG